MSINLSETKFYICICEQSLLNPARLYVRPSQFEKKTIKLVPEFEHGRPAWPSVEWPGQTCLSPHVPGGYPRIRPQGLLCKPEKRKINSTALVEISVSKKTKTYYFVL